MTQEGLSLEEYSFSRVINTSKKNTSPLRQSVEGDLETYFQRIFQLEPFPFPIEVPEPLKTPEENRRKMLDHVLSKLSALDAVGQEHLEEYLRYQYRRNFQSNTIRASYSSLSCFLKFLKEIGRGGIKEITKTDLEVFVEHEQDKGIKISSVKSRLAGAKAFLRFMIDKGDVREDVFPWKLTIKMPEPLPRAIDPDDVGKLLAVKGSVRDRAMIMLLLRTGMRIGELLRTRMIDVNMVEQKILIYEGEKNRRGRAVYFSDDAKAALEAWIKERKERYELIFYGYKGRQLSYEAARMIFVRYLDKARLSHKGYTLHCLRHTYATDLINARMPLECLEKLMGHSRLGVTRRYAMLTDKTREEEYFKAMSIIERRERDGNYERDSELQALLEKTQLLPSHSEELYEHP
jgi:site-specific recombinase XerD